MISKPPDGIKSHLLWDRLATNTQYPHVLAGLRELAERLAAESRKVVPEYTDHTIRHMDALWSVAEQVLTAEEIALFSPEEAFILGCTFYVHDLGMAYACTPAGLKTIESSPAYEAALRHAKQVEGIDEVEARIAAIQLATRQLHAVKAYALVTEPLPGINICLIQDVGIREKWAHIIGLVSCSHHWSLVEVEKRLGARGVVPSPDRGTVDLGFLACALRVIDYAHISGDRANLLDRLIRSGISRSSWLHWTAQANIAGPTRQGAQLVYASTRSIDEVDAWWLFYELAKWLDTEVRSVHEYLAQRASSRNRFSLEGVKGVQAPRTFATLIEPDGFEPLDVQIKSGSMERLVGLLGGKSLYGADAFAPVRELLQNARDAVLLQQSADKLAGTRSAEPMISVSVGVDGRFGYLSVGDTGIGMTTHVMSEYLLGIAADYWNSSDYYSEFPGGAMQTRGRGWQA